MKLSSINEDLTEFLPDDVCSSFGECGLKVYEVVRRALAAGRDKFRVVEGIVYIGGEENPIPHTWIELLDGNIVDPTVSQFRGKVVDYHPPNEYREEYTPREYVEDFKEQYMS